MNIQQRYGQMMKNQIKFTTIKFERPGIFAEMLERCYEELVSDDPEIWESERLNWEDFDREVFYDLDNADDFIFLTRCCDAIVGFASYFDSPVPGVAVIGHNCIIPEYRGNGFGRMQIEEILWRLKAAGYKCVNVTTNDHEFFQPARRMFRSMGFKEVSRYPWEADSSQNLIDYELEF